MRIAIVSNRLPVTLEQEAGEFSLKPSVGGLATGLSSYIRSSAEGHDILWIGWPGMIVSDSEQPVIAQMLQDDLNYFPVFLGQSDVEDYYHGFCNSTLWPLFHHFPEKIEYKERFWQAYCRVNRLFCDKMKEVLNDGDVIWVHDYHLLLLPQMLKEHFPNSRIGFFLHTPFPPERLFRLLNGFIGSAIMRSLVTADVLGFQVPEHLRCFQQNLIAFRLQNLPARMQCFPMSIDFRMFERKAMALSGQTSEQDDVIRMLSVDRLDYSKGLLNKLNALELFLQKYPQWRRKVNLFFIVVPSRTSLASSKALKKAIEEQVKKINTRYASVNWQPVSYHYREFSFDELVALYLSSRIALVTPMRDGMNLVAKEYLACRIDNTGVLILSETAGASIELRNAEIVDPANIADIADRMHKALDLPVAEQVLKNRIMRREIAGNDIANWAENFLSLICAQVALTK